jgi:enolase
MPLYTYFAELLGHPPTSLPLPMINLFSGGMHAGGQVPLQDLQVIPVSANTIDEALALAFDIFHAAADLSRRHYSMRLLRADEGGLAPAFPNPEAMFAAAVEAIQTAGYHPGEQVMLAIDVAASHFYQQGYYHLGSTRLDSEGMIARLLEWLADYPIASFEDPLAEEDWIYWSKFCKYIGDRVLVIGDDLLCTNPARIRQAIESRAANSLLLKVNQVGTLTEAAEACHLAKAAGWRVIASARSGDTEDNWLADLAVGWSADHIKVGSITQSERLAKYNRLLEIESATGLRLAEFDK